VTGQLLADGSLLYHTWVSLRRILLAFVVGATSGPAATSRKSIWRSSPTPTHTNCPAG